MAKSEFDTAEAQSWKPDPEALRYWQSGGGCPTAMFQPSGFYYPYAARISLFCDLGRPTSDVRARKRHVSDCRGLRPMNNVCWTLVTGPASGAIHEKRPFTIYTYQSNVIHSVKKCMYCLYMYIQLHLHTYTCMQTGLAIWASRTC